MHCHDGRRLAAAKATQRSATAWVLTLWVNRTVCNATGLQQVKQMPKRSSASARTFVILGMQGAVSAAAWKLRSHQSGLQCSLDAQ